MLHYQRLIREIDWSNKCNWNLLSYCSHLLSNNNWSKISALFTKSLCYIVIKTTLDDAAGVTRDFIQHAGIMESYRRSLLHRQSFSKKRYLWIKDQHEQVHLFWCHCLFVPVYISCANPAINCRVKCLHITFAQRLVCIIITTVTIKWQHTWSLFCG